MAMAMTGVIMIRISTDMYHHIGPRVAFCAAMLSGRVWAFALVRNNANKYSFHEKTSTNKNVAARPGVASGSTIDQKMRYSDAPSMAALSSSSSEMLRKESRINHTTMGRFTAVYVMFSA